VGDFYFWCLIVAALAGLELLTGSFYLLMLALGAAAAALLASFSAALSLQILASAVLGVAAVGLLYWWRTNAPLSPVQQNKDVHLDLGACVIVTHWNADLSTKVRYRGVQWDADSSAKAPPATALHTEASTSHCDALPRLGSYRIKAISGNRLILE
jgi:membrane protein implicated in regulation of membrane protease activity